jgi:hypothetical protein
MLVVRLDMQKFQQRLVEVEWITPGKPRHAHKLTAAAEGERWGHGGQQHSNGSNSSPDGQAQDSSGEGWVVVTAGARGTGSASKAHTTTSSDTSSKIAASQSWSKAPVRASVSDAEAAHQAVMAVASLNSWEALQLATLAAVGLQMGANSNRHKVEHTSTVASHRCLVPACLAGGSSDPVSKAQAGRRCPASILWVYEQPCVSQRTLHNRAGLTCLCMHLAPLLSGLTVHGTEGGKPT